MHSGAIAESLSALHSLRSTEVSEVHLESSVAIGADDTLFIPLSFSAWSDVAIF